MDDQRKSAVFLGKMAERAEHYRETLEAIKSALELTEEERVLISVAYKNVFASGLATLRILASIEVQELSNGNHHNVRQIRDYTAKVEAVLTQIHQDLNSVLTDHVNMIGDAYKNHRFLFGSYVMDSKQLKVLIYF
ncbi:hypothetical protein C2S52_003931 [Perilla frutescens var. hirtella]|nr:hypothetical protein C2S52_003931 [Perilla frutescens var. hirtella]